MEWSNFWQLLAGLGIFVFGLSMLEEALKELAGRTFKRFLKKHTDHPLKAILSGIVVTAVLQSSSVVTLMVLGFVGASVISMRTALAVVLGSNLGTTFVSWVVATLGFKLNIESFSFPIIAFAGAGLIIFRRRKKIYETARFFMGFGLMFLGLGLMKVSMEGLIEKMDLGILTHLNSVGFLFAGFILTVIIQASSATMVITLSALNSGIIPFESAVCIIIGSELGTSIKTVFGSIDGAVAKRRVALGNIIFNFFTTLLAFIFIRPLIALVQGIAGEKDLLTSLVMFQTTINLMSIILFLPFLKKFSNFLERRFTEKEKSATYFIQNVSPTVPQAALEVLEKETLLFIYRVVKLNAESFRINTIIPHADPDLTNKLKESNRFRTYNDKYDDVKRAEGEILSLYTKMNAEKMEKPEFERLNQLIASVRNAMYSAKGIKDIHKDRHELRESSVESKYELYEFLQTQLREFYGKIYEAMSITDQSFRFEELVKLLEQAGNDYDERTNKIYNQSARRTVIEYDVATLLNVSREVYSSCKAIILSLKEYLLDASRAENFESLPVSITRKW